MVEKKDKLWLVTKKKKKLKLRLKCKVSNKLRNKTTFFFYKTLNIFLTTHAILVFQV